MSVATNAAAQGQPGTAQPPASTTAASGSGRPTFEVGLGYQVVRAGEICFDEDEEDCGSSQTFPLGFAVDGVRNYGALGLVGEVGWSRRSDDLTIALQQASLSQNAFHYAAGVRFTGHNAGRAWAYGQILAGGITTHSSLDFDNDTIDDALEDGDTTTRFMIQPGVGVTIVGGDGWGVFGQVDYRRIFLDEDEDGASGRNDVRGFFGLRVILD